MPNVLNGNAARAAGLAAFLTVISAGTAYAQSGIKATMVATNLDVPIGVYAPPGDTSRIFIVEQTGRIKIQMTATNEVLAAPFLNISGTGGGMGIVVAGGERGLLGLAFHPQYSANGKFYINYTTAARTGTTAGDLALGTTVISEFTVSANPNVATPAETILLTYAQPFANHNGGWIGFGPDGMLYNGAGDGGSANDPGARAQNVTNILGKMLRLDVSDRSAADGDGMLIPDNNPFRGPSATLDEIWAIGMRNPWRCSFDRLTGDLYIADVGQDQREEINFQPALTAGNMSTVGGRNYGWRCMEGLRCTGLTGCTCNAAALTLPVAEYTHSGACSISGGYVYRGANIPAIQGKYFYADYCGNFIRTLTVAGGVATAHQDWTNALATPTGPISAIVSFGEDGAGEMYVVSQSIPGTVYRIDADTQNCGCPCETPAGSTLAFNDNFESNLGWSGANAGATSGDWQRGVPVNDNAWDHDPLSDADGSGQCFLTQNAPGNTDVDAGSVSLTSPVINALAQGPGDLTICYQYFLRLLGTGTPPATGPDVLLVEASSNGGGSWTTIATHNTNGSLGWRHSVISQDELDAAGISVTSTMRLRFTANDANPQTIVEAAVDAVQFWITPPITDCNNNSISDALDIANQTSADCNINQIPDECDIASAPSLDTDSDGIIDSCEISACCIGAGGDCQQLTESACAAAAGVWQGLNQACSDPSPCEPPPACPCDWNMADGLDSQDFFDFLEGFFAGDADFNGVDGTDSQDLFDFYECFFTGCE